MSKLNSSWKIQHSSANVLTFIVQDLLDYAQIKSGKFRKNIMEFNVINAVEEIMIIQQRKAVDNNIRLHATFENIRSDGQDHEIDHQFIEETFSYMVNTDQQRVMQVLLGLQSNALKFT
jgi:signal transduction histidine kinase